MLDTPAIVQIAGSIGDDTYARNPAGPYVRDRVTPTDPNTSIQQSVRTAMSNASAAWASCTEDQREGWRVFAANTPRLNRLGETITLTGQQAFLQQAHLRSLWFAGIVYDAPTTFELPPPPRCEHERNALGSQYKLYFDDADDWYADSGGYLIIQIGQAQLDTINFYKHPMQSNLRLDGGTSEYSPAIGYYPFTSPKWFSNRNVWIRARQMLSDGRVSSPRWFASHWPRKLP